MKDMTRKPLGLLAMALCAFIGGGVLGQVGGDAGRPEASATDRSAAAEEFLKAKALYDAGKFVEARAANEKVLQLDASNSNAQLLKTVLQARLGRGGGASAATSTSPARILTLPQVSRIRLLEMTPTDMTVRGHIDSKTLEDFWREVMAKDAANGAAGHDQFMRPGNFFAQAMRIRDSGQQKFMDQVNVTSDPAALTGYKNFVRPLIAQSCINCHDHPRAFELVAQGIPGVTADQIDCTNFYTMSMYAGKDGKMLDRDNPESSLLLQYGLPKASASTPHPGPELHRFSSTTDARYRSMYTWIKALTLPRPAYGIDAAASGLATSKPATRQSRP